LIPQKKPRHAGAFFVDRRGDQMGKLPSLASIHYRVWQILVYAFDKIAEFKPSFYLNFSNYKQAVNPILQRFCGIENSWYFCYRNGHYGNARYDKS
jgi:hypothetical protein